MTTYVPKPVEIDHPWHLVDAEGAVLGRLASEVAKVLRGKHRPIFAPHTDTGDYVVVINAAKVAMSGNASAKFAYRHSGYPGGLKATSYASLAEHQPQELVRRAVRGMLPRTALGRAQLNKLKVYAGPEHPHRAQDPKALVIAPAHRAGR
ncbi:MAG: 50S ribosomal protein L13 [Acidimicrobiales bacterium]